MHINIDKAVKKKNYLIRSGEEINVEVKITGNAKRIKI